MSKRCGRPGMQPSPNQKVVLEALLAAKGELLPEYRRFGLSINALTEYMASREIGGGEWPVGWKPWARSTVRDHLNDLFLKDLVVKRSVGNTAYYRPKLRVVK